MKNYPSGWARLWDGMCYHYYKFGVEYPTCGIDIAHRHICSPVAFDILPPLEFLELFESEKFKICKKCYKMEGNQ